jgi:hypothetical protein
MGTPSEVADILSQKPRAAAKRFWGRLRLQVDPVGSRLRRHGRIVIQPPNPESVERGLKSLGVA